MFSIERQEAIKKLLNEKEGVRISELASMFPVSVETIRRDLLELEKQGCLRRVHGGALRIPRSGEYPDRQVRAEKNHDCKQELVRYAAMLIQENDTIMTDCGSTAMEFAGMLAERFEKLTVITHSLDVFEALRVKENFELYLCSGLFCHRENAFYGAWTLEALERFHASVAFIFPSAISLQYGVMDYDKNLYPVQKKMMEQSDHTVFLADSNKFEKSGLLKLADLREGYTIVTDSGLRDEVFDLYQENRIRVFRGEEK